MGALDGKVAIVTGGGGGIGRAHALRLASEGARVLVNDVGASRDGSSEGAPAAERVVGEIEAAGGRAMASAASVATPEGASSLVETALRSFGKLDILINNAGILRDRTLRNMSVEEWDAVVAVHLRGTFLCLQAAARYMIQAGNGGRIINTTSVSGLIGNFGQANYGAAKAGIYGLTRVAHLELFPKYGITVNALAPVALTRMTEDLPGFASGSSAAPTLAPDYVADVAAFLASDAAASVSGAVVGVKGPQVWVYRMIESEPQQPQASERWSIGELTARWSDIVRT